MKKLIPLLLTVLSLSAQATVSIISDLDDTIKITNAADIKEATINGFFTASIYSGMDVFLQESEKFEPKVLHVVSAAPTFLKPRVKSILHKYQIPFHSVTVRNVLKENVEVYKLRVIRELINASSDNFILLGDDVDHDPQIYDEIKKAFPDRISGVYIHVVKGKELPSTSTAYFTTFDLALKERLAGRLSYESVAKVAEKILSQPKFQRIIPGFAVCPTDASAWSWQQSTEAAELAKKISDNIVSSCRGRKGKGAE